MSKKKNIYFHLAVLSILSVCNTSTEITQKILRHQIIKGKNGKDIRVSYISMTKFEDKLLIKTPVKSVFVRTIVECKGECIKCAGCVSLNLIAENETYFRCQLLDDTHYKQPYLLVNANDAEHHTLSTICSRSENICSTNGRIYCQPKFDSDSHTCKCVYGEHCTRKEVISNNARLWLDVFQHTTPIMKIRANFTFTSDVPDTVKRRPVVLYDSHRELQLLVLRIQEETFQLEIFFLETGSVLIPQMEPNIKYELDISTYFDASSDTMVYSARVDGNEVVRIEHNDQIFGSDVRFSFGECPFCSITGIEYNVDQNPSEFMANQQTLQKFKNVYKNWMFSIDVMKTTDILTQSNAFKICDENTEQKIITLSGSGSTGLKIKQPGNFLLNLVKNVYYKILITQLYSPLLGKYIVEIRVDGLLLHKQVLQNDPLERTNFYAYAGFPGQDLTQGIKYRNYLFYTF